MKAGDAPLNELAPMGKLRVAIAVGPAASALWTVRDPQTGRPRGVPVDLGTALAQKLGVPVEFVEYESSGKIIASTDDNAWDVTFVPVDDDRKKIVDFGAPYHLLQSTYLVAPGSTIAMLADANRTGVRIAIVDGTATGRASLSASPNATTVKVKNPDEAVDTDACWKIGCDCAVARIGCRACRHAARARGCSTRRSSTRQRRLPFPRTGRTRLLTSRTSSRRRRHRVWYAPHSTGWV